jgi:hypothetical protein
MSGGFCVQMSKLYAGEYERGPSLDGYRTFDKAEAFFKKIRSNPRLGREPLFLAGHSRGGAAVIRIAQLLKPNNIEVKAMFLFDAVDRTLSGTKVQLIPSNVRSCYHAMRDRSLAAYFESGMRAAQEAMDACMVKNVGNRSRCRQEIDRYQKLFLEDASLKHAMRTTFIRTPGFLFPSIDFGNCGVGPEPICRLDEIQCKYTPKEFLGTHGAMGGAPIIDSSAEGGFLIKSDAAAVASVRAWMWGHIEREGLTAAPPPTIPASLKGEGN